MQPPIHPVSEVSFPKPEQHTLSNGIPVWRLNGNRNGLVCISLVFKAGRWYEDNKQAARATAFLMREGADSRTSMEIAEELDFYGAKLHIIGRQDFASLTVYCMKQHISHLLSIAKGILLHPTFDKKEIRTFIRRNVERLRIDLEKNDVVSFRAITELIYGVDHPYGYNTTQGVFYRLDRSVLQNHHQQFFTTSGCTAFVSGDIDDSIYKYLEETLIELPKGNSIQKTHTAIASENRILHLDNPKTREDLQASIRIGRALFTRNHPDYIDFAIMNMLLGGYFGSRLMSNLREENGFTYGIYSSVEAMIQSGYFQISTEVGRDVKDQAINEIYSEIERLKHEPVGEAELTMVRNYLMGSMLQMMDGTFHRMRAVQSLVMSGMPFDFYDDMKIRIQTISPQRIQEVAQQYLNREDMYQVVVG